MKTGMRFVAPIAAFLTAGCLGPEAARAPLWEEDRLVGWRLTERAFGTIEDAWSGAGDGAIPGAATALVYEAVFSKLEPADGGTPPSRGGCEHELRLRYASGSREAIGNRIEATFWVDGPLDRMHRVEISGSHEGVVVLGVSGAVPLAGGPGLFVLEGRGKATVSFTSRIAGRGGVRVAVLGELGSATVRVAAVAGKS